MGYTPTNQDAALKVLYRKGTFHQSMFQKNIMLGLLPKDESFGGRNAPRVNEYALPQGVANTFSDAQANAGNSQIEDFAIDTVNLYSVATVGGELIDRARNDDMSYLKYAKSVTQRALQTLSNKLESYIPRDGSGYLGRFGSAVTVTNKTIALQDASEAANFEKGMFVRVSSGTTSALRTGQEEIAAVNRTTGDLTANSAQWDTVITAIAASDYIFMDGTAQNGGSSAVALSGFMAWIPASAPTVGGGDSFFGVDRSADSRLYGQYLDASSMSLTDGAIQAQSISAQEEGSPNVYLLHHTQERKWKKQNESLKQMGTVNAKGSLGLKSNVSYQGVIIEGSPRPVTVLASNKIPYNLGFMLNTENWSLTSMGPATKVIDYDGNRWLRESDDDGIEIRCVSRSQVECKHPIENVQVLLPTS